MRAGRASKAANWAVWRAKASDLAIPGSLSEVQLPCCYILLVRRNLLSTLQALPELNDSLPEIRV